MKINGIYIQLFALLLLAACGQKKQEPVVTPWGQITDTIPVTDECDLQDIQRNGSTYTVEEWKEVKAKYDKIDSRMGKYEYTAEEYREIGELKGKCVAYFAKGVATNVANKLGNVANQLKGVVEGVKSVVEETVGGVMKSEE